MSYIYLNTFLLLGLLAGQIVGQSSTASTLQNCSASPNMAVNISQISGSWYELARNPAPSGNFLCAQLNLTEVSSNVVNVSLTYSNTPNYPWVNQTMYGSVTLQPNNSAGYNISMTMYGKSYPIATYKILNTNYVNYTFVCGYRNVSNSSTYFAVVLTRDRYINSTSLANYETIAQSANYSLFSDASMTTIAQPGGCSANDGVFTAQLVSSLMVFLYVVIALFC